jgi:hypothetical protein
MYQSETAPRYVRGALVSCYQLFITLGILVAYCINFGTESDRSSRSWKIPMGIGFIWSFLMVVGILFMQESPRWEYRHGKIDSARHTIALSYGVTEDHPHVKREIQEIEAKLEAERAGGEHHPWYEIFTGPRMLYRTLLGITLMMIQQLTGANVRITFLQTTGASTNALFVVLLLLRYYDLPKRRYLKLLCHFNDPRRCELRHDFSRPVHCRKVRKETFVDRWRLVDVHVLSRLCIAWPLRFTQR